MTPMYEYVSIKKAAAVAQQFGNAEFTTAVDQARSLGLNSLVIRTDETPDGTAISVMRPQSIMIAWKPNDWEASGIAVPNGTDVDDIHMTVVYVGDIADFDIPQQQAIIGAVSQIAANHTALTGTLDTFGRFLDDDADAPGMNAVWVGGSFPGLTEIRDELLAALDAAGITIEQKYPTYVPHITIGKVASDADTPQLMIAPRSVVVDNLTVYIGGAEYPIELSQIGPDGEWIDAYREVGSAPNLYYPSTLTKAAGPTQVLDDEQMYTYGAWYVPDSLDAHGEFADRDTVQQAVWDYVDTNNREIHIQHMDNVVGGRWVELATVPVPISVPVEVDGVLQKHTYPAGTPFMGVKWEPWVWPLVKDGTLNGFSVGGTAGRIEAEFEQDALTKMRDSAPTSDAEV